MLHRDLTDPRWIIAKGLLFGLTICLAAAALLLPTVDLKQVALVTILVWSSARFYYFAFYVIERYVDPAYRFDGLGSMVRHLVEQGLNRSSSK